MISIHKESFKKHCFEMFTREKVVNTKIVMKPLRNSEYSIFDNSKKLLVLVPILSFLQKHHAYI